MEGTSLSSSGEDIVSSNLEVVTEETLTIPENIEETYTYTEPEFTSEYRRTGLLFEDMTDFEDSRRGAQTSPVSLVAGSSPDTANPPSASNLVGLPPVGNQGFQGSCVGWAWAYYSLTHQVAAANGFWDTTNPSHQFSPAFVYNQINFGDDSGSYFSDASSLINDFGCATMSIMPYSSSDYTTWPSETAYNEAMRYKIATTDWDYLYDDDDLEVLKSYLAAGNTATTGIFTRTAFYSFDTVNNIYVTDHASGELGGGHAVCIVGYDDQKTTADGPGAFLLVNSWGSGWGDNGFWWMSYEAIKDSALSQRCFYYCDVIGQPYTPNLIASFRISHDKRGDVLNSGFNIRLDQNGWTEWSETFYSFIMSDDSGLYQNYPFPGSHILIDLSDFSPYLSTYTENEFIIEIGDSVWPDSGVLESFSVRSTEWDVEATSLQTPHTIWDNQPRGEISVFLSIPSIEIDSLATYVGGTVEITGSAQGESDVTVLDVGFEPGSFEGSWFTYDDNPDNGDQLWGIDSYHSYSGGRSLWCGGVPSSTAIYTEHFNPLLWLGWPAGWSLYSAGTNSHPWTNAGVPLEYEITCSTGGLYDVKEWAYKGPIDTSSATELYLTFWMDYEVQNAQASNFASVLYSTDGSSFTYLKRWWAPVGETCSFIGEQEVMLPEDAISSTLYFAFIFQGDYTGSMTVDDIDIWDIGSEYENDADSYAYCYIDVSDFDSATMSFDYWVDVEAGFDWFSPGYYSGSTWITPYSLDSTTGWEHLSLLIPSEATRIGFYFHCDMSVTYQGVYVDNVKLVGTIDSVSQVELFIDEVSQGYASGIDSWSYYWDTTQFSDGVHNVSARAVFNSILVMDSDTTFVDNTAPLLTSTTDLYQSGNNITITGYVNSLGGSYIIALTFTSGTISSYFQNPITGTMINSTTVQWMFSNSTSIPDGYYEFEMTTTDSAGNNHTITMALTVDNTGPYLSAPLDIEYEQETTGHSIVWDCTDLNPNYYELYRDGILISTDSWSDGLEYVVDGLSEGTYTFTVIFWDLAGNSATDTVFITVNAESSSTTETTSTTSTDTSTGTGTDTNPPIDTPETPMTSVIIIVIAAGSAVVIVVVLVLIKRKTSS